MKTLALSILLALAAAPAVSAQLPTMPYLDLDAARGIATAAEAEARRHGWTVAIAVVDAAGGLIVFQRLEETQPASLDIAIAKARTAAAFKRSTKLFEDAVSDGRAALLGIDGLVPIEGGLPLVVDGRVIGAIGVSGVTPEQDGMVAAAGIAALGATVASAEGRR